MSTLLANRESIVNAVRSQDIDECISWTQDVHFENGHIGQFQEAYDIYTHQYPTRGLWVFTSVNALANELMDCSGDHQGVEAIFEAWELANSGDDILESQYYVGDFWDGITR